METLQEDTTASNHGARSFSTMGVPGSPDGGQAADHGANDRVASSGRNPLGEAVYWTVVSLWAIIFLYVFLRTTPGKKKKPSPIVDPLSEDPLVF